MTTKNKLAQKRVTLLQLAEKLGNVTLLDEFFRSCFRKKLYEPVQALQSDLDAWMHQYNYERPHHGYRNMGPRPFETIEAGKLEREKLMEKAA